MPLTYTGRSVKPGSSVYPSLVDIAVGISRQPRFAGQGRRWFSVLDHSLFMDEMVKRADEDGLATYGANAVYPTPQLRLAVLLHDAHEAITADVPTTFKGDELKYEQQRLDESIGLAFYPTRMGEDGFLSPFVRNAIRWYDRRALAAEARVIGPSVTPARILSAFGVTEDTPDDVTVLRTLLEYFPYVGAPPIMFDQIDHPGVREYLSRIVELM